APHDSRAPPQLRHHSRNRRRSGARRRDFRAPPARSRDLESLAEARVARRLAVDDVRVLHRRASLALVAVRVRRALAAAEVPLEVEVAHPRRTRVLRIEALFAAIARAPARG